MTNNEIAKLIHSLELACQLANTQQTEINRLKNELHGKVEYIHEQREVIDEKKAEIKRLKSIEPTEEVRVKCEAVINKIRAEAIEKFAEKLKEKFEIADVVVTVDSKDIDNLAKEMTGGEENESK